MILLAPIEIIPKDVIIMLWLFCLVLLIYIGTYIFFVLRKPLNSNGIKKIILAVLCVIGLLVIILIKFIKYNRFVILGFLISYVLIYSSALLIAVYKKKKNEKEFGKSDPDNFYR